MEKTNNISNLYKLKKNELLQLISKFTKVDDKLLNLLEKNSNDNTVITYIKNKNSDYETIGYSDEISNYVALKRTYMILNFIKYSNHKKIYITKYLDIGCFNGEKTIEIGKKLNLKPENIHGIDVKSFAGVDIIALDNFKFHTYEKDYHLPFEDNTFDFITLIQVLHHIKEQEQILNEIKRVLKPRGLLFIREHDKNDELDDKLIKLEHLLYSQIADKTEYDVYIKDNYEKYFSRSDLENKLKILGFNILTQSIDLNYKKTNPTKYYNMMVQLYKL